MKQILHFGLSVFLMLGLISPALWGQATTFDYTGGAQTYVVPPGVTLIQIEAWGAQGGGSKPCTGPLEEDGGLGGYTVGNLAVSPGDVLNIYVGENPVPYEGSGTGPGGYNGGGNCGQWAGGGGGASDVRVGGTDLSDRIIVAGGGGGGNAGCPAHGEGGSGGGLIGGTGTDGGGGFAPATGGTDMAGGTGTGGGSNGALGIGGTGGYHIGGGGGGYYGGGAAYASGSGGGSSYYGGVTDGSTTSGMRTGHGQVIVTVLCNPLTTSVSAEIVCFGEEVILEASSEFGGTVTWSDGVVDGEAFTPPVGTNEYTATSDADGDCNFTVEILVNDLPEVTAAADEEMICLGETVTFNGGGATTYVWDMDVEDGIAFEPPAAGIVTYTVTGTDDNGCENTANVDVEVVSPDVTATVDASEVCEGEPFIFTGGGAETYVWDMGVTDGEPFTAPVGSATYTVTGTDAFGCESEATIEATVNALPNVTATASETDVCFGDEVTFNGGGAATYDWDMGVTDDEPTVMDESGTLTFTVTGTDDNGCVNTASVDVTVAEEIVITYVTEDAITGADGSIDITVTGGVAPYTFDWDNDETGDFDDDEDLTGLTAGTYTVVVKDDNGCTSTAVIVVNSQVGITHNAKSTVSIYPNPTTGFVIIEHAGSFNYKVTDISGALILKSNGNDKESVSLVNLANGIYFVTIEANGTINTVKIIKE